MVLQDFFKIIQIQKIFLRVRMQNMLILQEKIMENFRLNNLFFLELVPQRVELEYLITWDIKPKQMHLEYFRNYEKYKYGWINFTKYNFYFFKCKFQQFI
ncbi:unnamed protein product [Paramecium sonneborni]|uniref:Uncharacterized protein n=1 Tax=Paramecium sonneborni TaxID=65129 RepID=A0A8S1RMN8_9CILI|nr:unnamed protein product [Paramecium sonneborni]